VGGGDELFDPGWPPVGFSQRHLGRGGSAGGPGWVVISVVILPVRAFWLAGLRTSGSMGAT